MNSSEADIPERYIREISELMAPVTVTINDNIELSNCILIYNTEHGKELLVRTKPGIYPKTGKLHITCAYSRALCIFKSNIIGSKEIDPEYTYLQINVPEEVASEERRKFLRVKPSRTDPIHIQFALVDKRVVTVEAMDISGGGTAFVLPGNLAKFKIGNSFPIAIKLPMFGEVQTWVTVQSMARLLNMVRVGMAFSIMSEQAHFLVMSYVTLRGQEMSQEPLNKKSLPLVGRAKICIIEKSHNQNEYTFLEDIFSVVKTSFSSAVSALIAHKPELIILTDNPPDDVQSILEDIKKHRALKKIPLIVLTEKEKTTAFIRKHAVIVNTPYNENFLIQTSENLIEQYRLSRNITIKLLKTTSGKGNKILIIDRFHNFSKNDIKALTDYGFEVSVNSKEDNILAKTEQMHPDIILIDEEMEKTNPISLCRSINTDKAINAIPKIIVTSSQKTFNKFYSQGLFAGFVTKPVDLEQLISKV
ncbi:response regulator, partial [bacterium]|nr:response regulator [bacterium]